MVGDDFATRVWGGGGFAGDGPGWAGAVLPARAAAAAPAGLAGSGVKQAKEFVSD